MAELSRLAGLDSTGRCVDDVLPTVAWSGEVRTYAPAMPGSMPELVADPDLVTPEWLTSVLRHGGALADGCSVTAFEAEAIGTGQVGASMRYSLQYDGEPGPATMVCKFASRDPQSAATGVSSQTYETEVAFYRDLAPTVDVSRPRCFFAAVEPGTANVVVAMEDLSPAEQGNQMAGCTVEQAALAIDEAAKLHGPRWGDPSLANLSWMNRGAATREMLPLMMGPIWEMFVDRYRATLTDEALAAGPKLVESIGRLMAYEPVAMAPVHVDFRLDNMLFHPDPTAARPLIVVDWQTVQLGNAANDVAYFIGTSFDRAERQACEESLVRRYHDGLLGYGVAGYSFEQCWKEYRINSYAGLIMAAAASLGVVRTDRGDEMFMAMANRSAQMATDLDPAGALSA